MKKLPKTKVYPIRLDTILLNNTEKVINPTELRKIITKKINRYLKTVTKK